MANEVLERGDIYFAYRPRVGQQQVTDAGEVQRLFMILQPSGGRPVRRIVVGRKRLPEAAAHERFWGFVDESADRPEAVEEELERETYQTRTRGERVRPESRPAGEGRYAVVRHGDHTHLVYELELPEETGPPQEQFDIAPQASYIVAVKNPEVASPPRVGLRSQQRADLPEQLQNRFEGRWFIGVDPDLLDHAGVEMVLIGAADDAEGELGVALDAESETVESAELFGRLRMPRADHPTEPLTEGQWR